MTPLEIKKRIEKDFNVTLHTSSRKRNYVYPRAVFIKLCREFTELGTQDLADMLGLKAHASVLNAINHTFHDAMYEKKFKNYYDNMKRVLSSAPSLQKENEELKQEITEMREVISFYREKCAKYGIFR